MPCSHHITHLSLHATAQLRQGLTLCELSEGLVLLACIDDVTVIAKVWVISATFMLERFNGRCKIDLALEKLLALNVVQFLYLMRHIVIGLCCLFVKIHCAYAHMLHLGSHLLPLISLGRILLVLIEVGDIATIGSRLRPSTMIALSVNLLPMALASVQRRLREHLWIMVCEWHTTSLVHHHLHSAVLLVMLHRLHLVVVGLSWAIWHLSVLMTSNILRFNLKFLFVLLSGASVIVMTLLLC